MKLHTNTITGQQVFAAAREAGVIIHGYAQVGSRSHDHGFTIYLEGSSTRQSNGRDHKAATWDEWGVFMSALYRLDYSAMWGNKAWGYRDASDFHWQTDGRFREGMPEDTHPQHKWVYSYSDSRPLGGTTMHQCNRCTARTRRSY